MNYYPLTRCNLCLILRRLLAAHYNQHPLIKEIKKKILNKKTI